MNQKQMTELFIKVLKKSAESKGELTKEVRDRLNEELAFFRKSPSLIRDSLLLFKMKKIILDKQKSKGSINKPNSMIFYLLGITDKEADLSRDFRFAYELDKESSRQSPPDIDIDFETREPILDYLCELYGNDHVALIGTAITYKPKAAVQMAAKALNVARSLIRDNDRRFSPENDQEAKRISKIMPNVPNMDLAQWLGEDENFEPSNSIVSDAMKLLKVEEAKYPEVFKHAKKLEGMIKSYGTHAAGVVISQDELVKDVPLHYTKFIVGADPSDIESVFKAEKITNLPSTQFDMNEVEELGLLKFDFLQLENLRQMTLVEKLIEEYTYKGKSKIKFDLDDLETDDPKVFRTIHRCKLEGLFQISGRAFRSGEYQDKNWETGEFLFDENGNPKMKHKKGLIEVIGCNDFDDIVVANAIGRPGPLKSRVHYDYVRGKRNPGEVEYPHEKLEDILTPTFGVLVYQEQLIDMARALAGFSFAQADKLRSACAKKKTELLDDIEPRFRSGCAKNRIPREVVDSMWGICVKFGEYAFNKSHSAAYGLITYQTAFLKTYYTTEFICAVLSSAVSNETKLAELNKGFKGEYEDLIIQAPDINMSKNYYVPSGNLDIVAPFSAIKGLGDKVSLHLVERQPYSSIYDFVMKNSQANPATVEMLIGIDVFRSFGDKAEILTEFKKNQSIKKRMMKNMSSGKSGAPRTKDLF